MTQSCSGPLYVIHAAHNAYVIATRALCVCAPLCHVLQACRLSSTSVFTELTGVIQQYCLSTGSVCMQVLWQCQLLALQLR
jgi:hypothetical protein